MSLSDWTASIYSITLRSVDDAPHGLMRPPTPHSSRRPPHRVRHSETQGVDWEKGTDQVPERLGYPKCIDGWRPWRWMAAGLREGGVGSRTRASYNDLAEARAGLIGSYESSKLVGGLFRTALLSLLGYDSMHTQTPRRYHVCPAFFFCVPRDDHTLTGLTPKSPRPRRDY